MYKNDNGANNIRRLGSDKAELHESSVVFNLHNVSLKRGVTVNALTRFDINS